MQVEVSLKRMQTNFGERGFSGFGDFAPFRLPSKTAKTSLRTMDYIVHGGQKIELAQKFMQVEVNLKCMQTNFGGCGLFSFGVFTPFCLPSKNGQNFPSDHGL